MNEELIIEQPVKDLILPAEHYKTRLIKANETYMLAARGTFKTSRGISLYVLDCIYEMPGSTGVGVGISYEAIGDNTLPPLLQSFEEFGFYQGEHFIYGKKPPASWPRSYLGVLNDKYDHVLSWHNGTIIYFISLAKKASANGVSAQWGFFDEAKFMDYQTLQDEILPIFRGNEETKRRFSHKSGYLSKFFATDKKADPAHIKWLLDKRKLVDDKLVNIVLTLSLKLNELKASFAAGSITKKQKLKPLITDLEMKLAKLRANMVYVAEISAFDVVYAHGEKWLKDKRRNTKSEYDFNITYGNEDPLRPGEGFYPDFDPLIHTCESDRDVDPNKPLIISADYQHTVAPIPVAQLSILPNQQEISLNYIDEVYTLDPLGLQEAVQLFCDRFARHLNRTVYYIYDQTATGKRTNSIRYCDMVIRILKKNKFNVIDKYTGEVPSHYQKYLDTREWLTFKKADSLKILINKRCRKLILSITGAAAVTKNGKTQKDKTAEQNNTLDQSETTHFSDAFDMINHAVLKLKLIKNHSIKSSVKTL